MVLVHQWRWTGLASVEGGEGGVHYPPQPRTYRIYASALYYYYCYNKYSAIINTLIYIIYTAAAAPSGKYAFLRESPPPDLPTV